MPKRCFQLLFLLVISAALPAQTPASYSSADILLGLQKLKVMGSVLYIAAHPDDENTRLLAYLAKEKKYRTGYLSLTRGDGGQNLIGEEQGISLGLIRTQELLAARRIDGAEQFFTRAFDFGFSKSTEEALRIWNKDKILSDVVWVIRRFRPDVIITRFPPDQRAGHGHHSASAALALEAFQAAADPNRYPEQLQFTDPWQAKRILWNTFNFGGNNTTSENQFKIDVGAFNPLLGKGYGEISAESRSQHKSQGFGVPSQRGSTLEYFSHSAGLPIQSDLMDGVETSWGRVKMNGMENSVDSILNTFDALTPSRIVPALLRLKSLVDRSKMDIYWREQKSIEISQLIRSSMGIFMEAVASQQLAVTGDSLQVTLNFINRSPVPVSDITVAMDDTTVVLASRPAENVMYSHRTKTYIDRDFMTDQPYWLREQMDTGSFNVRPFLLVGNASNPVPDHIRFSYTIGSEKFTDRVPLQYKFTDPVKGEIYQPVFTVPPIVVGAMPNVVLNNLVPKHPQLLQISYKSYTQRDTVNGGFRFELTGGTGLKEKTLSYQLPMPKNTLQTISLPFDSLFAKERPAQIYPWVEIQETGRRLRYNNAMKLIQYDHVPTIHYFFPNNITVINEEIKVLGKRVGYIPGSGDALPDALKQMGYTVTMLDDAALASMDLKNFDAIIAGVRAYNIKESLNNFYEKLMKYIADGGNFIVQYNTSNQLGTVKSRIGPYPFEISRTRVSDENAEVLFANPTHQVLNFPNKITPADFNGWKQERSIYHASNWDKRYETIFTMNDPGEKPDNGGMIVARYGKGHFVYTGLVFFRQIPAGVPGAYRLLANLIALNQKKGF